MNTIAITKFKEQCLSLLDQLDSDGLVITKHGKPIAIVQPCQNAHSDLIGCLQGKLEFCDDIFSTGVDWNLDPKEQKNR